MKGCENKVRVLAAAIALALASGSAWGGPVENALSELNAALTARNLKWKVKAELSLDPAESFRIEPYSSGGAYITGGDLRGLMYGLLEGTDQIRATGRFAKARGDRAAALRGVHIELDAELEHASEEFWRSYFEMLAHNRFNRAHVVFPRLVRPYRSACVLSRAAAEYAVDFTLGVGGPISAGEMGVLLATCPAVRSVAVEARSPSRDAILEAARHAGRLVTVDTDGSGLAGLSAEQVAVLRPPALWPPSFEVRAPIAAGPGLATGHEAFYWVWGRFGYDPRAKPPKDAGIADYEAARMAALHSAAAKLADEGGSDHVASAAEAVGNLKRGIASAKFTPLDIAARLEEAAAALENSAVGDLRAIGEMAKDRARDERAAYANALREAEGSTGKDGEPGDHSHAEHAAGDHNVFYASATSSAPLLLRPQMLHKPYQNVSSDQALPVTLRISAPAARVRTATPKKAGSQPAAKPGPDARPEQPTMVRLHYRTLDPQSREIVLEEPASTEVHFTIPGSDLTGTWDLFYYFEVLNAEGSGWFEPDPLTAAAPYFTVHIQAPRTGPN